MTARTLALPAPGPVIGMALLFATLLLRGLPERMKDTAAGLERRPAGPVLDDGARVAVIGGGPAGSFFAYFLKRMAATIDLDVDVEIYEPRFFTHSAPAGCNHCGGIVSESLVQLLATEGIHLPPGVVRRGIQSYVVHTDVGSVRIETPLHEKRIAALYRGNGPRTSEPSTVPGLDRFLQDLAVESGVRIRRQLVERLDWNEGRPVLVCPDGPGGTYDLVAVIPGAVLYERELQDMFGVVVTGIPDGRRLVLPDDWPDGQFPLRKDWTHVRSEEVIPGGKP